MVIKRGGKTSASVVVATRQFVESKMAADLEHYFLRCCLREGVEYLDEAKLCRFHSTGYTRIRWIVEVDAALKLRWTLDIDVQSYYRIRIVALALLFSCSIHKHWNERSKQTTEHVSPYFRRLPPREYQTLDLPLTEV